MMQKYKRWMIQYGHVYRTNAEKVSRFKIFKENVELIKDFNDAVNQPYKLGINAFADLTNEEFRVAQNGLNIPFCEPKITSFKYKNITAVPTTMDWRTKGAVTPIKDQGQCDASDLCLLILQENYSSIFIGILNRECVVLPPGRIEVATPEVVVANAINPLDLTVANKA
ncbi:Senescence-specific cysteine protease SAG39 [Capsicum baccatum]|uniref:Senescence-specific cysteine protease SAG39 n=1 Tax=Capsicum baccatum TaxID=33114 RepID=A0A2G2WBU1_CAPBA|nr:Senescence-specific cysteine protease SAG39 [Capsicum baccatum]